MKKYFSLLLGVIVFISFCPQVAAVAPAAPTHLQAVASNNQVYLFWEHSSELQANVLGYKISMSSDAGLTYTSTVSVVAPPSGVLNNYYIFGGLLNGQQYVFKITAYNLFAEESTEVVSNIVIPVDNSLVDSLPPENVHTVNAISGDRSIRLLWLPSSNLSGDLIGYKVYKSFAGGNQDVVYVGINTEYVFSQLTNGQKYDFRIVAVDAVGNESQGVEISSTPQSSGGDVQLGGNPVTTPTFRDVVDGTFRQYIEYLAARKVVYGYADGTFRPQQSITRAEAVTLLMRASGLEVDPYVSIGTFFDVSSSYGLAVYIENAYAYSIVDGYPDGSFQPDRNITRGEFTKIFIEIFSEKLSRMTDAYVKFSDVPKDHTFAPWVYAAYSENIVQGYGDQTFRPDTPISREQAAAIIARYFQNDSGQLTNTSLEELQILSLINNSRVLYDLVPYKIHGKLSQVAQAHAIDLGEHVKAPSYIGSDGSSPSQRVDEALIVYRSHSENVAVASYTNSTITDTLSAIHSSIMSQADNIQNQKANILSTYKNFTDVGVGVYVDTLEKNIYVVVDFIEIEN